MQRYRKYFLSHIIWLRDQRAEYLVQDPCLRTEDIFGVELETLSHHYYAVDWLNRCKLHDPVTMHKLRKFLAEKAPRGYLVHRMDDSHVIDETARTLMKYRYPIVIRPEFEPPWRATNTIDVLCAVKEGASPAEISKSAALAATETKLKTAHSIRKAMLKKDVQKHHQAQLKLLNLGERPVSRAKLLPHTGSGWQDPDALKKVLINNVGILFTVSPNSLRDHAVDTVVSGKVIDEFIAWLDNAWPPPEQMEQLLAAFTLGWLYERIERPSAEAAKEIPKAPVKKQKETSLEPPIYDLNIEFHHMTISQQDNQILEEKGFIENGYDLGGPKKRKNESVNSGFSIFHGDIPNGSYTVNFKGFDVLLEHNSLTD